MANQSRQSNAKKIFIEAFWSVAESKSINKVKVEDIVKKSGYNRTSFYRYFKDVNDIINEAEKNLLELLEDIFYEEIYEHKFSNIAQHFIAFEKKAYVQYYLVSTHPTYLIFSTKLKNIVYEAARDFEPFANLDHLNKQMVIDIALGGLRSVFIYYLTQKDKLDFEKIYNQARKYILFGVNDYVHPKRN